MARRRRRLRMAVPAAQRRRRARTLVAGLYTESNQTRRQTRALISEIDNRRSRKSTTSSHALRLFISTLKNGRTLLSPTKARRVCACVIRAAETMLAETMLQSIRFR